MPNTLPAKTADDLGTAVTNARAPRANEVSAVNFERIKDRIVELGTELGLTNGSTPNSVWAALLAALTNSSFSGSHAGELRRTGAGTYAVARHTFTETAAPTTGDNAAAGYLPGSLWLDVSNGALYMLAAEAEGSATWITLWSSEEAPPESNVESIGSGTYQLTPWDRGLSLTPTAEVQIDILNADFDGVEPVVFVHKTASAGGHNCVLNPQGGATVMGAGVAYNLPGGSDADERAWILYRRGDGDWLVVPLTQSGATTAIQESSGPTVLTVGVVGDGQLLVRDGTEIVGVDVPPIVAPITETGTTRTLGATDHGRTILYTHASGCEITVPHTLAPGHTSIHRARGGAPVTVVGSGGLSIEPSPGCDAEIVDGGTASIDVESSSAAALIGELAETP